MKNMRFPRRFLAIALTVIMLLGLALPASAVNGTDASGSKASVRIEKVDNSEVNAKAPQGRDRLSAVNSGMASGDSADKQEIVRVSIVLEAPSTIAAGYSTMNIAQNSSAMSYRESLRQNQARIQNNIERLVLGGQKLDVVWNLTLAANIISANVTRGDIAAIEALPGVKAVVEEMQYYPDVVSAGGELQPQMALAGEMTGSIAVWNDGNGYTGAGTKIAIIDTGLDMDHQSFDSGAFDHAISTLKNFNKSQLLTSSKVVGSLKNLNIADQMAAADASKLYKNSKVPFGYNYVDKTVEYIDHDKDGEGEHGSHVAGIAAANRFVDTDGDKQYEDALASVLTAGNAPDAQLIVMKVFGQNGGAYDSDYMAAIEDAVVLGADAINLSLGSAMAGHATSATYQNILDDLSKGGSVVTISAGNSGYWAENTTFGLLYSDGVNFSTDGSPGSYANAFTVASVDNQGMVGAALNVDGNKYSFSETSYTNEPIATLDTSEDGSGTEFDYIFLPGNTGADADGKSLLTEYANLIQDKVVFVFRGASSFYQKHMAAEAAGAVAVVVVDNVYESTFNMDLTGSTATIPAVCITLASADKIQASTTPNEAGYYTGKIIISDKISANAEESSYHTMSSFSSWGVPGDLSLKPEITAPGGNIWSVNGAVEGGKAYELMSGTSMAAPQVAGLSALVQQYLREERVSVKGLNSRALTQALLMSTAEPMIDGSNESECYYPVFQQGAGLANVSAAISTPVVLTVAGQADGKVKAELGDDPGRDGVYPVTFTLHNLDAKKAYQYTLSGAVFTQDVWGSYIDAEQTKAAYFLDTGTYPLEGATVSFDRGSTVTVPAGGSVTVKATITIDKDEAEAYYDDAGMYVEAYLFAKPSSTGDGVELPELSIPVLGYYGSWTEPSMFDVSSLAELVLDVGDTRYPYLAASNDVQYNFIEDVNGEVFAGAPYDIWSSFLSAKNGGLANYYYAMVRNAGNGMWQVTDAKTGKLYYRSENSGSEYAAFFSDSANTWAYTYNRLALNWAGTDSKGNVIPDGTVLDLSVVRAPEYYANAKGEYNWDTLTNGILGDGAYLTTTFIMDSTAPELNTDPVTAETADGYTITVSAADNFYVAEVDLYADDGETPVGDPVEPDEHEAGEEVSVSFDVKDETVYLIVVWDYAGNYTTYRLFVGVEPTDEVESVELNETELELVAHRSFRLTATVLPITLADRSVTWSSSDEAVATVDATGLVTGLARGTATITAASVMDPSMTAECVVTVTPVNVTLHGVLADDNGDPKFFDYNVGTGELTMGLDLAQYPVAVADVDKDSFYLINTSGNMYLMDKATGEAISGPSNWSTFTWSTSNYSEAAGGVFHTYGPYILGPDDPDGDEGNSGWNFSSLGDQYFMSVAVLDQAWEYDLGNAVYSGEFTIYAIDDYNRVWELPVFLDDDGSYDFLYGFTESDLTAEVEGYEGMPYSNLIVGDDGTLYYSVMTNNTNEVYSLTYTYDEETDTDLWESAFLFDVGYDVWPALLLNAERLRYDFDGNGVVNKADAQLLLDHVVLGAELIDCVEDVDVDGDYDIDTHDVHTMLAMLANGEIGKTAAVRPHHIRLQEANIQPTNVKDVLNADESAEAVEEAAQSAAVQENSIERTVVDDPTIGSPTVPVIVTEPKVAGNLNSVSASGRGSGSSGRVSVPVAVKNSSNGEFTLEYDTELLTFVSTSGSNAALTSVEVDEENGIIHAGYAAAKGISTTVLTATFTYVPDGKAQSTELTLSVFEENDGGWSEEPVESEIKVTLPAKVVASPAPSTSAPGPSDSDGFIDVNVGDWFYDNVYEIAELGLMKGLSDTVFAPYTDLTRGMLATIIYRAAGSPAVNTESSFEDVASGMYYADPIAWADANGIIIGYSDTEFGPKDNITREQLATVLWRYAQYLGIDVSANGFVMPEYADLDDVSSWALEAMCWAVRTGIVRGRTTDTLVPGGTATRAEVAAMMVRFLKLSKGEKIL